jgi:hypothetical protein
VVIHRRDPTGVRDWRSITTGQPRVESGIGGGTRPTRSNSARSREWVTTDRIELGEISRPGDHRRAPNSTRSLAVGWHRFARTRRQRVGGCVPIELDSARVRRWGITRKYASARPCAGRGSAPALLKVVCRTMQGVTRPACHCAFLVCRLVDSRRMCSSGAPLPIGSAGCQPALATEGAILRGCENPGTGLTSSPVEPIEPRVRRGSGPQGPVPLGGAGRAEAVAKDKPARPRRPRTVATPRTAQHQSGPPPHFRDTLRAAGAPT